MAKIFKIIVIVGFVCLLVGVSIGCAAPSLKSLTAYPDEVSITENATQQLYILASYTKGAKYVTAASTYQSSNENIATVTKDGVVKGVAIGSANITASHSEGGITKTVLVPVTVS